MYRSGYFPIPGDEAVRLARLEDYEIYGRSPELEFDQITQLAAKVFDVPVCLISIIGKDTQWLASREGLDVASTPRDAAFCSRTIMVDQPLVVLDAAKDAAFHDNPLVVGEPGIRFYAGAPLIVEDDVHLGALCLIDQRPHHQFDAGQRALLRDLAAVVAERLVLRRERTRMRQLQDETRLSLTDQCEAQSREVDQMAQQQRALLKVIDHIDTMTRETHMLAINSAIEAARHGENGRAFAVIAEEIKKLAVISSDAAVGARYLLTN